MGEEEFRLAGVHTCYVMSEVREHFKERYRSSSQAWRRSGVTSATEDWSGWLPLSAEISDKCLGFWDWCTYLHTHR
jgi:hypothetical protein